MTTHDDSSAAGEAGGEPALPRVCFLQAYNRDYIRTETLLEGLRAHGVPLQVYKVNERSPRRYPRLAARLPAALRGCDVVFANFRSFEFFWALRLATRLPIVHDAHISFWQSACEERGWFAPESAMGRVLFAMDRWNCAHADHVILDTDAHRRYFVETFGLPEAKFSTVFISCEEALFQPAPPPPPREEVVAFWSGTGIPLQGLDVLCEAFRLLATRGVPARLRVAGESGLVERARSVAAARGVANIEFLGNLPRSGVVREIAAAEIGLGGHYSRVPKAKQVIAGKAYEIIAMRRPVVLGDCAATREVFTDGVDALLCEMGSAPALADAVERLVRAPELRERLAGAGRALYEARLRPALAVAPLVPVLRRLAARSAADRARPRSR